MVRTETIPYLDHGVELEGFLALPEQPAAQAVIVCHAWRGRDPFICAKAQEVAQWGYAAFALDIYGKGVLGQSAAECAALKRPFLEDRDLLRGRLLAAYQLVQALPGINSISAVGFGFGGLCALELARCGIDLAGAVSIYGHFDAPPQAHPIRAKIFILHGYDDPITPQSELLRFQQQLNEAGVDWQTHLFGGTLHAFATPGVNDPENGLLYHPRNAARAWSLVRQFLDDPDG
jgi:dienelactone hydrolase